MGAPVSLRLDDEVHHELESLARQRGIDLETLLCELAATAAREARTARIREESAAVARYVRSSPEAQAFYEDWGTPTANVG
jgi:predicted transcriptional regulator